MFAALEDEGMPWERTAIYQVDERVAPAGDPDRNLTHLLASLPAGARTRVHPMPVEAHDLDEAAAAYATSLPERFDLVHLGLGADGHTASLVPGDPVLEVADRDVALTGPYRGRPRMTLTYPALARASALLWLVAGKDKAEALRSMLAGDPSIPAGRVAAERSARRRRRRSRGRLAHGAPLDAVPSADDHLGDELGREEPVVDDARGGREARGEGLRVVDVTGEVGDDAAVGAARDVPQLDRPEPSQRRGQAVLEQLERDRRADPLDELVRGDDDDEALGRRGDELLAGVGRSPPFTSQPDGATWSAPSMATSSRDGASGPAKGSTGIPSSRAACSVAGEVATQRSSSLRAASAGSR